MQIKHAVCRLELPKSVTKPWEKHDHLYRARQTGQKSTEQPSSHARWSPLGERSGAAPPPVPPRPAAAAGAAPRGAGWWGTVRAGPGRAAPFPAPFPVAFPRGSSARCHAAALRAERGCAPPRPGRAPSLQLLGAGPLAAGLQPRRGRQGEGRRGDPGGGIVPSFTRPLGSLLSLPRALQRLVRWAVKFGEALCAPLGCTRLEVCTGGENPFCT